jgi:hypothetical protein
MGGGSVGRRTANPVASGPVSASALTAGMQRRHSGEAMFFFIGGLQPRREVLDPGPLRCPRCGRRSARIEQVRSYLSLFFVPLVPVRRGDPYLICDHCGAVQTLHGDSPAGFPEAYAPETYDGLDEELEPGLDDNPLSCPECGGPIEPEFDFCPYCGKKL